MDYGEFEGSIRKNCGKLSLKDVDGFVKKCIQLYETTVVRHGLMLVGPAGSGKTMVRIPFTLQLQYRGVNICTCVT